MNPNNIGITVEDVQDELDFSMISLNGMCLKEMDEKIQKLEVNFTMKNL